MATIDERNVILKFNADTSDLDKGVKKVEATTKGLGASFRQAGATFAGMFALQGLNAVTQGLTTLGQKTLSLTVSAEQTRIAFETFLGSASKAQSVIKELNEFSALTPFQSDEVLKAGQSLLAFGVDANDLKPTLTALGDIASGTGTNFNELAELFGKAKVQGRLFAEDINQLTGRGIPVIQEFAKQFGVTESEVKGLVESGQIGFKQLETAFQSLTGEGGKFFELTARQSDSLGGRISTLKDNFDAFLKAFGERLLPTLKQGVEVLISFIAAITPEAVINFGRAVLTVTASFISYNLATNGAAIATAAYRVATAAATVVTRIFNTVVKANPIGLLVSALTLAIGALYSYSAAADSANAAQAALNETQGKGVDRKAAIKELEEFAKKDVAITQEQKDKKLQFIQEELDANKALLEELDKAKEATAKQEAARVAQLEKDAASGNAKAIERLSREAFEGTEVVIEEAERRAVGVSRVEIEANIASLNTLNKDIEGKKIIKAAATKEEIKEREKALKEAAKKDADFAKQVAEDAVDAENAFAEELIKQIEADNERIRKEIEADSKARIEFEKVVKEQLRELDSENAQEQAEFLDKQADVRKRAADKLRIELLSSETLTAKQREDIENNYTQTLERIDIQRMEARLAGLEIGSNEYLNLEQEIANAEFDLLKSNNERILAENIKAAEQRIELAKDVADSVLSVANDALKAEQETIDKKITAQEKAVNDALKIAEKGGAEQLQFEENRLQELEAQKERNLEKQRILAAIEIAINNAVAVSQGIVAVTKAFAEGNLISGIATSVALAATIASAVIALRQATADIPAFAEGTEYFDGKGTGTSDSNLVRISRGERVVTAKMNDKYFDTLNEFHNGTAKADYLHALAMGEIAPSMVSQEHFIGGSSYDSKKLERLIEGTNKRLDRMDISVNLDKEGFAASISQWQNKKQRVNSKLR